MRVDAKGNKLDSDVVSEIVTNFVTVSKAGSGVVVLDIAEDYLECDIEAVEEIISAFNTAIALGWLEPTLKEVK